ncbi:MAG: MBL fold metallo-hydrolase [Acidobacteria bacterium]|nr:MBL fold metallo-hydrolase [Acidobacteriota bacterium]
MKRAALAIAFAALLAAAFRRDGISQPNLVRQIAPGVFYRQAEPEKNIIANTGWIVFDRYVLVVDANFPWGARAVLPDLKKTTGKPIRFVFDTHYHGDHAFGNSIWVDEGATLVCSEDCRAESLAKNPAGWEKSAAGQQRLPGDRLEHPQITFRDRLVFDDGARRVELLRLGPAHTRGDAVAYLPKERVLFTGDLCVNRPGNNVADADADPDGWLRALDAMGQMDIAVVVPGHGEQGGAETLRGQRAYLADLIQQVRSGTARGATAEQLEKEVDLSRHKPWGQDEARNRSSVRAVHAKLSRGR